MAFNSLVETLYATTADGTAISASTTAASLLPATVSLPASYIQAGSVFKIVAAGRISNVVTTPGTLTLDLRLGGNVVATSPAMGLNVVAKTDVGWLLEWWFTARTGGTAATLMHQGRFTSESVVGSAVPSVGGNGSLLFQASAPAVGTAFDATVPQVLDFFGKFSVNTSGTAITCHQFILQSLI